MLNFFLMVFKLQILNKLNYIWREFTIFMWPFCFYVYYHGLFVFMFWVVWVLGFLIFFLVINICTELFVGEGNVSKLQLNTCF